MWQKLKWGCAWLAMRTHNGNYSGNNCARLKLFLNSLDFVAENWEQIFVYYCFIRKFCFDNFPLFIVRSAGTAFFAVVKRNFAFMANIEKHASFGRNCYIAIPVKTAQYCATTKSAGSFQSSTLNMFCRFPILATV